jgi:mannose-1-phosphate guanylyltransferase
MIQETIARLEGLISDEHIFIVSVSAQKDLILKQLPQLRSEQVIIEPRGKNTAACIGLSALYFRKIDPEAVMAVLPADHCIKREKAFRKVLKAGEIIAEKHDCLVTIGIRPTYPATGYGYVQHNEKELERLVGVPVHEVKTFAEKPERETAESFVASGDFLWNSGIFIWKVKRILAEIEEKMPDLYDGLTEIDSSIGSKNEAETVEKVYKQIQNISIDYGVMEKSHNVVVLKSDFGWSDVGSWKEVHKLSTSDKNKNAAAGDFVSIDTNNCFLSAPGKLVATIGVDDLIVVDTKDALLICNRDRSEEVKQLVDLIKRHKFTKHL